jgi:hypothetical protein
MDSLADAADTLDAAFFTPSLALELHSSLIAMVIEIYGVVPQPPAIGLELWPTCNRQSAAI